MPPCKILLTHTNSCDCGIIQKLPRWSKNYLTGISAMDAKSFSEDTLDTDPDGPANPGINEDIQSTRPKADDLIVTGIGASAGGLEAL
ncbi:MAG: hypothetical protein ACI9BO_001388 [Zhongshania sp.]|jgi:hypothetical protein